MRQVLYLFHGSHSPSEESQKGCFLEKSPGGPKGASKGGSKYPWGPTWKKILSLIWESDQYHAFFLCILVYMKRIKRGAHQTNPLWAVRPQYANPSWMRMMGSDCEQSLEIWLQYTIWHVKDSQMAYLLKKNLWLLHAAAYLSHCCIASAHFIFSIEMSWTGSKVKNKCHLMCWRLLFGKLMEQMFNRLRICGPRLWWK